MRLVTLFPIGIALAVGVGVQDDLKEAVDASFAGHWTGSMTYREGCPSHARTVLPTILDVSELPSGGLRMSFAYRELCRSAPSHAVCDFVVSADGKSVSLTTEGRPATSDEQFTVTEWAPERHRFVMANHVSDAKKSERYSVVFTEDELTVTREVASADPSERREYHFRRG